MPTTQPWEALRRELITSPKAEQRVAGLKLIMLLAETRERRGLSQRALAETMGTTQANVSRVERGDDLRVSTLQRYAQALGGRLQIDVAFEDDDTTALVT
jgi:transcriptional regulator with XRE-family HTH domain